MYYIQLFVPAILVFVAFVLGHGLVAVDYSGVYFDEDEPAVLIGSDPNNQSMKGEGQEPLQNEGGLALLPDKYNYLKIENVFQGQLSDTDQLFSAEFAIATLQTNVSADFFIKAIYEIEADLVNIITKIILDTTRDLLATAEGRKILTQKVMDGLNAYLEEEGYNPDVHYVYMINYNII